MPESRARESYTVDGVRAKLGRDWTRAWKRALRRAWTATWKIVAFVVLWGILYSPAAFIAAGSADASGEIGPVARFYLELLGAVTVMAAAWILAHFVDHRRFVTLGFTPNGILRDLSIGLAVGTAMIALAVGAPWLAGWVETVPAPDVSWAALGVVGSAMLFNSVSQEVLVRGYMLQTIESEFDVATALVVSSLIFTALHAGPIVEGGALAALNLFAAGMLLGLAYTTTGNLWLPIALHFSWNFLQGPVLGIAVSGQPLDSGWELVRLTGPAILTGGSFGLEGGLVGTVATLAGIAAVLALGRRSEPPEPAHS